MKIIIIFLAFLVCVTGGAKLRLNEAQRQKIVGGLEKEITRRFIRGGRNDIIPPIPDPWELPKDSHILKTKYADGGYSYEADTVINGLGTFRDDIYLNFLTLIANGTITIPAANIAGNNVIANVNLKHPISGEWKRLESSGALFGSVEAWSMSFNTRIVVDVPNDRIRCDQFKADVAFKGPIVISTNQATWGGAVVNWNEVNQATPAYLKDLFENHRPEAMDLVQDTVNRVLDEWPLSDIIGNLHIE